MESHDDLRFRLARWGNEVKGGDGVRLGDGRATVASARRPATPARGSRRRRGRARSTAPGRGRRSTARSGGTTRAAACSAIDPPTRAPNRRRSPLDGERASATRHAVAVAELSGRKGRERQRRAPGQEPDPADPPEQEPVAQHLPPRLSRQERATRRQRRAGQHRTVARSERQRERRQRVGEQVQPQQLERRERDDAEQRRPENERHLGQIRREQEPDRAVQVVLQDAPLGHRLDDRPEILAVEHHVRRLARQIGRPAAHGDPDVGRLEGGGVVDAVADHRHHLAARAQRADDGELVRGGDPGEHRDAGEARARRGAASVEELGHRGAVEDLTRKAELAGDRRRRLASDRRSG